MVEDYINQILRYFFDSNTYSAGCKGRLRPLSLVEEHLVKVRLWALFLRIWKDAEGKAYI